MVSAEHRGRMLTATYGEAMVRMPRLREMRFTTAAIERCRHHEISVEGGDD